MTEIPYREEDAELRLTADEAIVLFELLSRWSGHRDKEEPSAACFESSSECAVLHGLLCDLESRLVAPIRAEYAEILEGARARLEHRWSHATLRGGERRKELPNQ